MSSPKERRKARRRAEKQMELAVQAALDDDLVLAEKQSRRAIEAGQVNPRLWLDHGRILARCGATDEAEDALRHAIALAPTYADAFAELASLQAACGKIVQAERLQARAVELAPADAEARRLLDGYRALLPEGGGDDAGTVDAPVEFTDRTERYSWDEVEQELRAHGMAKLPELLSREECAELIAMWDPPDRFEHEVALTAEAEGRVEYRFFAPPLPPLVAALRAELYARAARIANDWNGALHRADRFPARLDAFLRRCRDAGQHRSTPILLRYAEGGFNAPHRDVAGKVVFPFQLAVTLGPGCSAAGDGGELLLVDERPGKKVRKRALPTGVGDAVLFCTAERLVVVGGALGLQPVVHGVAVTRRERFALGVPFHEHG